MTGPLFVEEISERGIARITLTRSKVHNAFNDTLIRELTAAFDGFDSDDRVRAVILAAQGKYFSAGADLNWMKAMAEDSEAANRADAQALAKLMSTLDTLSKPTIALVQGSAFGGGVGLAACCDIVVAVEGVSFALSEVRLGLIPAVIAPYVVAAIGARAARRYFQTGERISAWQAHRLGLVHEVVSRRDLESTARQLIDVLLAGGPRAQTEAKELIYAVANRPLDQEVMDDTAERIARVRRTPEGREGIAAFLEKRKPEWHKD